MLMIGVSTEQNTTNLIPAIQCGITHFLVIETSHANEKGWAKGLKKVLQSKGVKVDSILLDKDEDSHITKISKKIEQNIKPNEPVIWNVGGGQKPQQLAIWQTFQKRLLLDKACYANPNSTKLEWWEYGDGALQNRIETLNVNLTAEEILTTFGYIIKENSKKELIYKKGEIINLNREVEDLLKFDEFRELLFRLPAQNLEILDLDISHNINEITENLYYHSQDILSELVKKLDRQNDKNFDSSQKQLSLARMVINFLIGKKENNGKIQKGEVIKGLRGEIIPIAIQINNQELKNKLQLNELNVSNETLKNISGFSKTAFYFEQIVIQRIKNLLDTNEHNIIEAYANLEIAKQNNQGEQAAEYDILCVTNKGTIFAFDAKTFDFERKDSDARLHNLSQAGGHYVNFYPVIPFDLNDVNKDFFPKKLRELPEKLKKRGTKFYVITDNENNDFKVILNGNHIEKSEENNAIDCKILNETSLKS